MSDGNNDQPFNEDELKDIMDEIENLEGGLDDSADEVVEAVAEDDAPVSEVVKEEELIEPEAEDNVVDLASAEVAQSSIDKSKTQGVGLNATGDMNVSLSFKFNGEASKVEVADGSVKIILPGVEVAFDEASGCQINAENGMTFQLPLKKSA
ncbi:MAG: hypothetical protein ACPGJV_13740 [Bacteriovoracaceae bacterium]